MKEKITVYLQDHHDLPQIVEDIRKVTMCRDPRDEPMIVIEEDAPLCLDCPEPLPQKQPNTWSCLPTALAILLGVDVAEVIKAIGHDGHDLIFPDNPDPYCFRGFHAQEITHVANMYGFALSLYTPMLMYEAKGQQWASPDPRFNQTFQRGTGILIVEHKKRIHAVALYEGRIYDPGQSKLEGADLNRKDIYQFWRLMKV